MNSRGRKEQQEDVEARTEESAGTALVPVPSTSLAKPNQGRASLSALPRQLTPEELDDSGVKKLLIGMLDEAGGALEDMQAQNTDLITSLQAMTEKYHSVKTDLAVANERMRHIGSFNWLENLLVALGGALLGTGITLFIANKTNPAWIFTIASIAFFILLGFIHNWANPRPSAPQSPDSTQRQ